jgi:hypothetical protein
LGCRISRSSKSLYLGTGIGGSGGKPGGAPGRAIRHPVIAVLPKVIAKITRSVRIIFIFPSLPRSFVNCLLVELAGPRHEFTTETVSFNGRLPELVNFRCARVV